MTSTIPLTECCTRVVLIGDTQTGKTSIINRHINSDFSKFSPPTIGASVYTQSIVEDNLNLSINFYDTTGQEAFRSICKVYYRNTSAAIVVFDITNIKTFNNIDYWINEYYKQSDSKLLFIAANKTYLKESAAVTYEEIHEKAQKYNCEFIYTSALDGTSIEELFDNVIRKVTEIMKANINDHIVNKKQLELRESKTKSKCCGN